MCEGRERSNQKSIVEDKQIRKGIGQKSKCNQTSKVHIAFISKGGRKKAGAKKVRDTDGSMNAYVPFFKTRIASVNQTFAWNCFGVDQSCCQQLHKVGDGRGRPSSHWEWSD